MIGMDELRVVSPDPHAHYFGTEIDHGSVNPGSDVRIGSVRFDDWLAGAGQRQGGAPLPAIQVSIGSAKAAHDGNAEFLMAVY